MGTIIEFSHVTKEFPGVVANDDVSFSIEAGEVFALVGENGAGKSTLMNLLYGMKEISSGEIIIKGEKTGAGYNAEEAMRRGISMVHQHFKLVPSFSVAENVFLGHEIHRGLFVDKKAQNQAVSELSKRFGIQVNPTDTVRELSVGLQQRVEILKALRTGADVLILDEPTAVLTPQETDELFAVIRRIVEEMGMTVILITHKLPEVMAISDRVGVMRMGRLEKVLKTKETSEREIASLMVGRDVIFDDLRTEQPSGQPCIEVKELKAVSDRGLPAVCGVNISVHAGEIVGICGVEGNGQTELAECIAGMRKAHSGTVLVCGKDVSNCTPAQVRNAGLCFIPEDRMTMGVDTKASITENLIMGKQRSKEFSSLGGAVLHMGKAKKYAEELGKTFDIRMASVEDQVGALSGGNMQKVVLAREFSMGSQALLISQPTRGVDIGATEFIHESIIAKRNEGCGILLISADLDELFRLSDRLLTLYEGKITGSFKAGSISKQEIGYYMTGSRQQEVAAK